MDEGKTRNKIVKLASTDWEFPELGTNAFVAMINVYLSYDCQIVCKVGGMFYFFVYTIFSSYAFSLVLDIGNFANVFGLVRMPKNSEIKKS